LEIIIAFVLMFLVGLFTVIVLTWQRRHSSPVSLVMHNRRCYGDTEPEHYVDYFPIAEEQDG
jgi:hypothetical protein